MAVALTQTIPPTSPVSDIGSNIASAANVTANGSADLVSAATNTGGIIITSVSMAAQCSSGTATLDLTVNGSAIARITATATNNSAWGGFCAIKIPSGQAVGYTGATGSTVRYDVYLTWKAA